MPRATAALNSLRQIGGSIGTAFLAVVLQHEGAAALVGAGRRRRAARPAAGAERAQLSEPLATAFGHTFSWSFVLVLLAIVPAVALLRAERRARTRR